MKKDYFFKIVNKYCPAHVDEYIDIDVSGCLHKKIVY